MNEAKTMRASEVSERISRGEACPCCGVEWFRETPTSSVLNHRNGCAYITWQRSSYGSGSIMLTIE